MNRLTILRTARVYHRWLMLFVGIQFLLWSISGLYMVMMNIHYIHGEHYLKSNQAVLPANSVTFDVNMLIEQYPRASEIRLGWLHDKAIYRFKVAKKITMIDALTGQKIPPVSNALVNKIAISLLQEPMPISKTALISDNHTGEIGSRGLPLWQVEFAGPNALTLYISQQSGELMYTRHNAWRGFDILWRLHIMDYTEGADINNILLNMFTVSGVFAVFAGTLLLYLRLSKRSKIGSTL